MRYSDRVQFLNIVDGAYNPKTSKKEIVRKNVDDLKPCNINPLSLLRTATEFGTIERDISVLRLQGTFNRSVTHCIVNGREYVIKKKLHYTNDTVFYIEEVK